ncbi:MULTISPECIES: hypothetical protein [unclassified Arsenophonus]|uniref:type III secretion apparatus assembly protein SctX n=2 Tax=Arsenophonus TaxID=637 RepID=UPI0028546E89|nr:hypothetical protein [Arsenophonus sp.]MDR5611168.1 hypothetical protein [Arsenophonus sp.]MDR5615145.1 hypothetical protein [Arsenophonus sp.]
MRKINRLDSPSAITAITDHFSAEIVEYSEIEPVVLVPNGQAVAAHFSNLYPTFCIETALLNYVTPKLITPLLMTPIFLKLTMARLKQQLAEVSLPEVAAAYDLLMELADVERQLQLATSLLHRG